MPVSFMSRSREGHVPHDIDRQESRSCLVHVEGTSPGPPSSPRRPPPGGARLPTLCPLLYLPACQCAYVRAGLRDFVILGQLSALEVTLGLEGSKPSWVSTLTVADQLSALDVTLGGSATERQVADWAADCWWTQ